MFSTCFARGYKAEAIRVSYLGNFDNLDDEKNDNVVVTDYQDFRKIVCACIKAMRPKGTTDADVEELFKKGGGEGIAQAMYSEGKRDFAEGRYVYNDAAAVAMNYS